MAASSETPPSSRLSAIPPSLVRGILQSAVCENEQNMLSVEREALTPAFRELSYVSKEWHALARDTSAEIALRKISIGVVSAKRSHFLAARRQVTLQRAYLRTLTVKRAPLVSTYKKLADQWAAILACTARLEELVLAELQDPIFPVLGGIIHAAGQQCSGLASLVVSNAYGDGGNNFHPNEELRKQLTVPLLRALDKWRATRSYDGLRHLSVSRRYDLQNQTTLSEYLTKVITCFPKIEIFDGFRVASCNIDQCTCYELHMMDLPLWTRFCESLSHLSEFDWVNVPFATRFFEIFGQFPKPNLTKLILTTAMNWDWTEYQKQVGAETLATLQETGFGGVATNIQAVLRACPNLETLSMLWYNAARREDQTTSGFRSYRYPTTQLMNPELFGDDFCEAVVQNCPRVATFSLTAVIENAPTNRPIASFTDRGMRALARLPWLRTVDLEFVNVTGDGIYELVIHHAASSRPARSYIISVGDPQPESSDMRFYEVLMQFLEKLSSCSSPLACEPRDVTLILQNEKKSPVDKTWCEQYFGRLTKVLAQVRENHPSIAVNVFAHECTETGFAWIPEFVFTSKAATARHWKQDGDTERVAGVWDRLPMRSDGDFDMDADFYDDEDDFEDDFDDDEDDMSDDYDDFLGEGDEDAYGDSDGDLAGDY